MWEICMWEISMWEIRYVGDKYVGDMYVGDMYVGDMYVGDMHVGSVDPTDMVSADKEALYAAFCSHLKQFGVVYEQHYSLCSFLFKTSCTLYWSSVPSSRFSASRLSSSVLTAKRNRNIFTGLN